MKPSQDRPREQRRQHTQSIVERHFDALFRRMPMLCGFSMRQDLEVSDIAVNTWPGHTAGQDLYEALAEALADLLEERPNAVELLRGRTFARALH